MILNNLIEAMSDDKHEVKVVSLDNKILAEYDGKDSMKKGLNKTNVIVDIQAKNNIIIIKTKGASQ